MLGDGSMDVVVIRDGASRAQLISLFLQLESGKHVDSPCVEYYKVTEAIWEPQCRDGMVCIDGELAAAGTHPQKTKSRLYTDFHRKCTRTLTFCF